jgi:hypothetical protein
MAIPQHIQIDRECQFTNECQDKVNCMYAFGIGDPR